MKRLFYYREEWILGVVAILIIGLLAFFYVLGMKGVVFGVYRAVSIPPREAHNVQFDLRAAEELGILSQ